MQNISQRKFLRYFPVPSFLRMPAVGLDISEEKITIVELKPSAGNFAIGKFGDVALPAGVFQAGDLARKAELISLLRAEKDRLNLSFVNVSIPDEKAYLFRIDLPILSPEEVRQTIEFKLEENVPLNSGNAFFEYKLLKQNKSSNTYNVTVVARDYIESYVSLLGEAGLVPLSFETSAQAVVRSVIPFGEIDQTFIVVHFGESKTSISIVDHGIVSFTSTIAIGSNTLTSSLMKTFSIGAPEAEVMKREGSYVNSAKNVEFFSALTNTVSVLKDEINKVRTYWETHTAGQVPSMIGKVILSGPDLTISGLALHLSSQFKKPVLIANVWSNVCSLDTAIPEISFEKSLGYAPAIGLALLSHHHA